MENKKFSLALLVIILVFGFMLVGCDMDSDHTYTVWVSTESYSEYASVFGTLNDGYYRRIEVFSGEINYSAISNEYKRNWTQDFHQKQEKYQHGLFLQITVLSLVDLVQLYICL